MAETGAPGGVRPGPGGPTQADDACDKAGAGFWDGVWREQELPRPLSAVPDGPRDRAIADFLRRHLSGLAPGARVLEVGCGGSVWLPFIARHLGLEIAGLDYAEEGCELERRVLESQGLAAEVICADLFDPPSGMMGVFDAVVSFGVVEHFEDTAGCLRALGRFVRPGGTVVTEVPNLCGVMGRLLKRMNRPVYDTHVPLDVEGLARSHGDAGLEVVECGYLLSIGFAPMSAHGLDPKALRTRLWNRVRSALARVATAVWRMEARRGRPFTPRRALSPYVVCAARRPVG